MDRRTRLLVCLTLLVGLTASCGGGNGDEKGGGGQGAGPVSAKKVRIALSGFENNITPFTMSFGAFPNTHDLMMLVHDSLFWSQVKEKPEPWLAESATPSPDFKTWTVKLRPGATWHDGRPVTTEDIAFTFDYYQKQAGASGRYAHHVFDVPPFESASIVDERTIRLTYKAPAPQFEIMPGADLPIIPKHVYEGIAEPAKASTQLPVGSGPYKVVEIVPDQRYRLQAHEGYFKGKPTVDELELVIVKDPAAAFAALRTGEVSYVARNVPAELSEQFRRDRTTKLVEGTTFESTQLYFNARKPPLSDAGVRKAISLGVDTKAIVDTALLGRGRPGHDNYVHPDSPWALPGGRHEHDPARAQRTLDEAGYSAKDHDGVRKSADGKRLEFSVLVSSFEAQDLRAAQLMAQQVGPLRVKLNPEPLDPAALRERRRPPGPGQPPPYDAYVASLEAHAHVDPDALYYFFHSPGPKGFGAQITGYSNARFDALVEQAALLPAAERKPVLHDAQRILAEESPMVIFWYRKGEWAYRPDAYAGWVNDHGHSLFTKRSFLPEYAGKTAAGR